MPLVPQVWGERKQSMDGQHEAAARRMGCLRLDGATEEQASCREATLAWGGLQSGAKSPPVQLLTLF